MSVFRTILRTYLRDDPFYNLRSPISRKIIPISDPGSEVLKNTLRLFVRPFLRLSAVFLRNFLHGVKVLSELKVTNGYFEKVLLLGFWAKKVQNEVFEVS